MKGMLRIFKRYINTTLLISAFLLIFNLTLLAGWVLKEMHSGQAPSDVVKAVAEGIQYKSYTYSLSTKASTLLDQKKVWAMLIDDTGHIIWSYKLPNEVPRLYSITSIASFTQSFLEDYPVFVWKKGNSLVVIGYPKGSIVKYQYVLPTKMVSSLPVRILSVFVINIIFALLLSFLAGNSLIRLIRPLLQGVDALAQDKEAYVEPKGVLSELASSVNQASVLLRQKDDSLKQRDEARSNWIAGISHDIRTPLSMVLGHSSDLENNPTIPEEQRHQAAIIRQQAENLRSLVNDLNLVSMLEYEMQPLNNKPIRLSAMVRQITAEFLNNGLDESFTLDIDITEENVNVIGDERLLKRALTNLIQNSIRHNPGGCKIKLQVSMDNSNHTCSLIVEDNGKGIAQSSLYDLCKLPYSSDRKLPSQNGHGLGLPMADRIAHAHHGKLCMTSDIGMGFRAEMVLPCYSSV